MATKSTGKKSAIQSVKGMRDLLPKDQAVWEKFRAVTRDLGEAYGFARIDTPLVEASALFERGMGETSDVVEKQMFSLKAKDESALTLRPEFTAPVVRAYIEHGMSHLPQPVKLYYMGPLYRHEQPQEGRYREFYQSGFEIIGGESDPIHDAQMIIVAHRFLEEVGMQKLSVLVNSIGCKQCRPIYRKKLVDYYKGKPACKTCKKRLLVNPLRVLDCKEKECDPVKKGAPAMIDSLCVLCRGHFKLVLEYLDEVKVPYILTSQLVRGLDYYNRTVFEVVAEGSDMALGGGGRYDYLVELLGGKATPASGFALGLDRIALMLERQGIVAGGEKRKKAFFVNIGDLAKKKGLGLIESLRRAGVQVEESLGKESLKGQLAIADKRGADIALIFGQMEAFEESIIIRDLKTGAQETVLLIKMVDAVKRKLHIKE